MASALEHYVNDVRTLSASGNFRELIDYLNSSVEVLAKNTNILDNVLETLDMQQHSLGVLYVLVSKFTTSTGTASENENLIRSMRDFISSCNGEQVRLAPAVYNDLCHLFTNHLIKYNLPPVQGIKVLSQAIEKIQLFESQVTAIHSDLCQLCLSAKNFNPALKFLSVDITAISTTDDGNHDVKYFLQYYYYGGLIYAALKNYERSLYFFEVAISTPALAMSHIMLESYKKFILVSLILHGKVSTLPKNSSQVIARFIKPLSHPYHELANAFSTSRGEDVRNVMSKYREKYVRDKNLGLVKQVYASLYKKNIQRLTQTFLTLSLADVADKVQLSGPVEVESYILNMIKSGEIFAEINQKDGMIVFKDDPEKYNTPEMFQKIQSDITQIMELNKQIVRMEEEIKLNPQYIKKSVGNQDDDAVSCPIKSYPGAEPSD